ncbi:hypothetical protein NOR_08208 [Metarhizium rileyi]|uniref:Uncharacterized protein n=1 Tax=Metarhizium rileyi (strain RCEF 4871) TaxID=1649241 RepID=A0A166WPW3_METRR|nr:hypothetical protein NOR_08208 [Metarhizium rileyi RCEF 4871]
MGVNESCSQTILDVVLAVLPPGCCCRLAVREVSIRVVVAKDNSATLVSERFSLLVFNVYRVILFFVSILIPAVTDVIPIRSYIVGTAYSLANAELSFSQYLALSLTDKMSASFGRVVIREPRGIS